MQEVEKIQSIIKRGEGLSVEFKENHKAVNKDVYHTVCAFLNRAGGELLLGVRDNGEIVGVHGDYLDKIKAEFTTTINNAQKITPPFYLVINEVKINGKMVLYIYVPESSQVHRCNGRIYDRNEDGDFNITDNNDLVSTLFLRKQTNYSENTVYPYAELADFKIDVIERAQ